MGWVKEEVTIKLPRNSVRRTKLASTIVTKGWEGEYPRRGGNRPQPPALRLVNISEESDGLSRNIDGAPEIHFEHLARLLLRGGLDFPHHGESGIIINDVDATEPNFGGSESVFDIVGVGYIDLEDQELTLCRRLGEVMECFRLSRGGDNCIPPFQHTLGEG